MRVEHVELNVKVGDEFKVYHPITNAKAVFLGDGTDRTMHDFIKDSDPLKIDSDGNFYRKLADGTWQLVNLKSSLNLPLGLIPHLQVDSLNSRIAIRWTDPGNVTIHTTGGEDYNITEWAGTKVVIKNGSEPTSPEDGTLIEDVTVRDKYKTLGLVVEDLFIGEIYYVKLFPYTKDGIITSTSNHTRSVVAGATNLGPVTGLTIGTAGSKALLSWSDPLDQTVDFNGSIVPAARWHGTNVVMKAGSYPQSSNDGRVVASVRERDKYAADSLVIDNLEDGITYYFALFPFNVQFIESFDAANRAAVTISYPALPSVTGITASRTANNISLKWTDPVNVYKTVNNEQVLAAEWASTIIVRKEGSTPQSINDGSTIAEITVRDLYKNNPYTDSRLSYGSTYYYKLFGKSKDGVISAGATSAVYVNIPSM